MNTRRWDNNPTDMNNRHLIDSAVFDIGFSSEETAFELQSELNGFINQELLTVVAEVFDASSLDNTVLRLPVIELDLGAVPYTNYRDELPRRLREKLAELLVGVRQSIGTKAIASNQVLDRRRSRRELVEYFLLHGHLPWHASLAQGETIEKLLMQQLASEPQALSLFLRSTVDKQLVIDRLVAQFHQDIVDRVAQLLVPDHAGRIKSLAETFLILWRQYEFFSTKRMHVSELGGSLWSKLILVLLSKGSRQLNVEQLFERALMMLLPELSADFMPLLNQLKKLSNNNVDKTGLKSILLQLTEKQSTVGDFEAEVAASINDKSKLDDEIHLTRLRQHLVEAMISGDFSNIKAFWAELLSGHATLLEETLRHYGQQAQYRKRIAYGFPESVLQQLLQLIEPVESGFIIKVLDQSALFQPRGDGAVSALAPAQNQIRKQLWQFSLGYLLLERGSRFNKKSYLSSFLRQMAMANNLSHAEMLLGLTGQVAGLSSSNATTRQLLQLLTELGQELNSNEHELKEQVKIQQRGYEAYEKLVLALCQGGDADQADLIKAVTELEHRSAWLLMRFLRELQCGRFERGIFTAGLSAAQLRHLVLAFIRISNQGETSASSELINAVETYSGHSTDLKVYFLQILNCLLQGELIDFDAILAGSGSVNLVSAVENEVVQKSSSKQLKQQVSVIDGEQGVIQYLHSDDSLTDSEATSLIRGFECLFEQHPQSLRRILTELMTDKRMILRLVTLLPERLLSRSLSFMEVVGLQRLQQYAEIITTACHTHELKIEPGRLKKLKWQVIFAYLKDVGPFFNEKRFVEYFLAGLATDLVEPSDSQRFNVVVSQQLVANSLPSTRDMTQRVVQWLAETTVQPVHPKTETSVLASKLESQSEFEDLPLEDIHISNAGIVLAAPYLARLFEMLGLTEKSAFKDSQAAVRGVHMLQFLVDEHTDCPEYQLVLNKLLCGVKTGKPIAREVSLSPAEKQQLEGLLRGLIQNWKSLGNTSVAGLRESFLQRQGRLQLRDDAWHLLVEAKPFDMLLDQIPWSYSTIKFPWMERVIYVEWR